MHHVADLRYIQNTPAPRLDALRQHALTLLPAWLPLSTEFLAVGTGLALAPVAIGLVGFPGRWRHAAWIGAASLGVFLVGQWAGGLHYPAFASEGTWLSDELGSVVTLIPGWRPVAMPAWMRVTLTLACWASFAVVAVSAIHGRPRTLTRPVFAWALVGLVLMTAVLWLATDRYILPFLSPALALVLGRGTAVRPWRAAVAIGVFALIGGIALHDRSEAERAVWSAIGSLRQQGVPVSRIDAGYTANGWLQYAHPDHAYHDAAGHVAVPFVNGDASLPWIVSVAPMPDAELVSEYHFRRTGRSPRTVYVSRRTPGAATTTGR